MAIMIPGLPLDYDKTSKEDVIFSALKAKLPDDIYVAHSFKIVYQNKKSSDVYTVEIDFLVIIPNEGMILLESKAGQIYPETGRGLVFGGNQYGYLWHLANGEVMKYNGPFRQVQRALHTFESYLSDGKPSRYNFGGKISFAYGVCLPTISQTTIDNWNLPSDAGDKCLILSRDDIENKAEGHLLKKLRQMIDFAKHRNKPYFCLNEEESKAFVNYVIAPPCNLTPSEHFFVDLRDKRIHSFLRDQTVILDFMAEQKVAVIGGGAGTGKTLIAIEKAKRVADEGKEVLFLCFNRKLRDRLVDKYAYPHVRYETIDSLFFSYFKKDANGNYNPLKRRIESDYEKGLFPYKHFIIDEAQDFGRKDIEGSEFLKLLQTIAELEEDACCYYFYDKYQLVQSREVPSVILNADCKMMLHKNCRNTQSIATTSYKVFFEGELSKRMIKGFERGSLPVSVICEKEETFEEVSKMVKRFRRIGYKDIAVLSAREDGGSILSGNAKGDSLFFDGFKCTFTTCRRFKGLEAEAVILVDINRNVLADDNNRLLFYVGASRAKYDLGVVLNLSKDDCAEIMKKYGSVMPACPATFRLWLGTQSLD